MCSLWNIFHLRSDISPTADDLLGTEWKIRESPAAGGVGAGTGAGAGAGTDL